MEARSGARRPKPKVAGDENGGGGHRGRPGPGGPGPRGGGMGGPKRPPFKRRVCRVCQERKGRVDWKAVNFLRTFVTDRGKIMSGRSRGTCSDCQRQLTRAIKRARTMALLPFSAI